MASVAATRSRRVNAGSRMRELIEQAIQAGNLTVGTATEGTAASGSVEAIGVDEEPEDADFHAIEEDDIVDSDFASTDEEAYEDEGEDSALYDEEDERKKAALPRKEKVIEVKLTQEQLLEEAKETEAINLASLHQYELMEEERRKAPKKTESAVTFMVRWRSVIEVVSPGRNKSKKKAMQHLESKKSSKKTSKTVGSESTTATPFDLVETESQENSKRSESLEDPTQPVDPTASGVADETVRLEGLEIAEPTSTSAENHHATENQCAESPPTTTPPSAPKGRQERTLISFTSFEQSPFAQWAGKPKYPEHPICPITGLPAQYKDPKTGIPYANLEAFKTLRAVLNHRYVWSALLGTYLHSYDTKVPQGVPQGWFETTLGKSTVPDENPAIGDRDNLSDDGKEMAVG
ncbi:hypothetical protein HK102_010490 [Quaeritorhiza haematococci]|nr:hypothetical protein HK102_010490 [Quaeritorhiza haematococci]